MKSILSELNKIETIMGSFIFTIEGEIIITEVPDFYLPQLPQAIELILRSFAPQQAEHENWELKYLYITFEEGILLCRYINEFFICTIAQVETKIPFLNVALNVATQRLKAITQHSMSNSGAQQFITPNSGHYNTYTPTTGNHSNLSASSSQPITHKPAHYSQPMMTVPQVNPPSSGGYNTYNTGQFAQQSSSWTPPPFANFQPPASGNFVSRDTIKTIAKILAQFVGPASKMLVKKHLRLFGVTSQTLPTSQLHELLSRLENELNEPEARMTFREKTAGLS